MKIITIDYDGVIYQFEGSLVGVKTTKEGIVLFVSREQDITLPAFSLEKED